MNRISWKSQIVNGRVFELRSKSKHYPTPCALVANDKASDWGERIFAAVDRFGTVHGSGYTRLHNPKIYIAGIKRDQFNSSRVLRRRRDLERFDADDLALIRYGLSLDFSGRIRGTYSDMHIPTVIQAEWTVFWLPAWDKDDCRWMGSWHYDTELDRLMSGTWHFYSHGGSRHLGYRFGQAWATRHTGKRLNEIRKFLRRHWDGLIEQPVKVARWQDGDRIYTEEIRRECPALGSRWCSIQYVNGNMTGVCR